MLKPFLAAAALALLALHPADASTYNGSKTALGPGGLYSSVAWASGGATACEDLLDSTQFGCSHGGVGGVTFDVRSLNPASASSDPFVVGTCEVDGPAGASYTFVCSTDRDDDGRYSNIDAQSSSVDGFDDDFVVGDQSAQVVPLCFARDGTGAGGDWDDVRVFIEGRDDSANSAIPAFYTVSVSLTTASSCGGANTGAHSTGDFEDTNGTAPPPPPAPANGGGWACGGA